MQGPRKHAGDATQLQLKRHHEKRTMSKGHVGNCGRPIPASAARQASRRWCQKHAASQSRLEPAANPRPVQAAGSLAEQLARAQSPGRE